MYRFEIRLNCISVFHLKRCPVKTNSLDMTPVRSQTSLNFLKKKKGCEFCNEFQIDLLSYVLSRIERIIKQTNTVSYSVALKFCGSKICDFYVVFHYPLKTVPAKKNSAKIFYAKIFSTGEIIPTKIRRRILLLSFI